MTTEDSIQSDNFLRLGAFFSLIDSGSRTSNASTISADCDGELRSDPESSSSKPSDFIFFYSSQSRVIMGWHIAILPELANVDR